MVKLAIVAAALGDSALATVRRVALVGAIVSPFLAAVFFAEGSMWLALGCGAYLALYWLIDPEGG